MSKLSNLNSNSINGLMNISCDTLNTSLISNEEINTLNMSNTSTTLQNQINIINTLLTSTNSQFNTNQLILSNTNLYPFMISGISSLDIFKISNTGLIYVNGSLIDFATFITSSYLNTALASYVSTSSLNTTLSSYVSNSSLSSALNGYFQKSETWSKTDIANIQNDTLNSAKTYTDGQITTVNATFGTTTAALGVSIAGLSAGLVATNLTVSALTTTVSANTADILTLNEKTQYITSGIDANGINTNILSNLNISQGLMNNIILKQSGEVDCISVISNTATIPTITTKNINSTSNNLNIGITTTNIIIGSIGSVIYIGGFPYYPFNVFSGISQW